MESHTMVLKQWATELGFDHCGIARAERLNDDAERLEDWLVKGMHGNMQYMANHFELRVDPTRLVPGAKSVITLMLNYYPSVLQVNNGSPKISKYAYGEDYHEVIRGKLNVLLFRMRERMGNIQGRGFVDSAPVLERAWANRSGLGWIGKNGNLITKSGGSFFFICTLIVDLELVYDDLYAKDFCGSCTKCIDACPTEAISGNKVVNGSKCISYFTIELKEMLIPQEMNGKFDNWAFGCDICQDVCPWNRFSKPSQEQSFQPIPGILNFTTNDWEGLTQESFSKLFRHSPIKRAKLKGLQRNLRFLSYQDTSDK
jgi:epoxyqueuosine reductase